MKPRFLLHLLSHNIVVVDITEFGISVQGRPAIGIPSTVPAFRFAAWREAQDFLRTKGADTDALETTFAELKRASVAVLTITK